MMRKNRALAVALALIMSLTYMPATAFAENTYEDETAGVQVDLSNEVTTAESNLPNEVTAAESNLPNEVTAAESNLPNEVTAAESNLLDEVTAAESKWGAWSAWQDEKVNASSTRQVETRRVVVSYTMETYVYTDSSSPNLRGYWPHATANTLRNHAVETWPKEWVDSARWVITAGNFYNSPDNDNCDGLIHDGTGYVCVHGQPHDYVPFFIVGTNYKKQYRYRDKVESGNSSNDPSNPGGTTNTAKINISSAQWRGLTDCTYTGKPAKRDFTLRVNGINLRQGTDYKVRYKNNRKVGTATIIVTGCGKYYGTTKNTYKINPKGTVLRKCTGKKNKIIVRWKKQGKYCSGYQIRYATDPRFRNCKVKTIKGKNKKKCTISKLEGGKLYYVAIRAFCKVGKVKYYSTWSNYKAVKVKKPAASKKTYKYVPEEFTVKYTYASDDLAGADVKFHYNKYGLVDKMTCVDHYNYTGNSKLINTFNYTFHKNKSIKTAKVYMEEDKFPWETASMNQYGALIENRGYKNQSHMKGKATYYKGTNILNQLELTWKEENATTREKLTFDKEGYLIQYKNPYEVKTITYNEKGLKTKEVVKENGVIRCVNTYKYKMKKGRVVSRKDYVKEYDDDGKLEFDERTKTITIKKWKKVKVNQNSLKAGRYLVTIWTRIREDRDPDLDYPTFVYEWK